MAQKEKKVNDHRRERMLFACIGFVTLLFFIFLKFEPPNVYYTWVDLAIAVGLLLLFYSVDVFNKINFKATHYFFMTLAATVNLIFGPFSFIYFYGDKINHFIQPLSYTVIFFYMLGKLKLKMKWRLVLAFFIVIGILGMFEVAEFGLDKAFDARLQGVYLVSLQQKGKLYTALDGLEDTDWDLLTGMAASLIASSSLLLREKIGKKPRRRIRDILNSYEV